MMSKKQMMASAAMAAAAACGVDIDRIMLAGGYGGYSKRDLKDSKEVQDKKILDAKIKRIKKAMIKDRCSKEEIQAAIDIIKIEHNEQNNSNC